MPSDWSTPLVQSLAAGMSTCLGAALVFCQPKQRLGHAHLAFALSLAGSVMVTVSLCSILPEAFTEDKRNGWVDVGSVAFWECFGGFGLGGGLYILLSRFAFPDPDSILELETSEAATVEIALAVSLSLIDDRADQDDVRHYRKSKKNSFSSIFRRNRGVALAKTNQLKHSNSTNTIAKAPISCDASPMLLTPTESTDLESSATTRKRLEDNLNGSTCVRIFQGGDLASHEARRAWRVAMLLFVSLGVHNFPEGLAVAASNMHSKHLGLTTAIAIALHNIPEGIAIAIPCLAARPDSPWLAFGLASMSGMAEPLGALVALAVLDNDRSSLTASSGDVFTMHGVLAFVAGIMIMVAVVELFPEAMRHMHQGDWWPGVAGSLAGIIIMLASDTFLDS